MSDPSSKKQNPPSAPIDPVAFGRKWAELAEHAIPAVQAALARLKQESPTKNAFDPMNVRQAMLDTWYYWAKQPDKLNQWQVDYFQACIDITQQNIVKFMGQDTPDAPVITPDKSDRRFRDPAWTDNAAFDTLKQLYLLTGRTLHAMVSETQNINGDDRQRLDFALKQWIDALSPSNFALTNPEVLRLTLETGGQNLLHGMENMVEDVKRGNGTLKIAKTDYNAFKIGHNLAMTPGDVIFRNDLFELIQYTPTTPQVDALPVLIVPPWINKYYILDMRPDNSFIKWAVDQGLTVYVMSWVNPTAKLARKSFDDYVQEGLLQAAAQIRATGNVKQMHVVGYCIGGTLLATTLAYAERTHQADQFASATFLTTLIDFRHAGELRLFTDKEQIEMLERVMAEKGVLDAGTLQNTFSLLRANDLIWSFVVNNYLMGREPFPFDLLYWNDDSTNMPAAMHSYYLRNMYLDNQLAKPDALNVSGTPIDVRRIRTPSYFLSAKEDHIAPWLATYEGAKLLSADVHFVLSGSGHVAGVVNPPMAQKYHYWDLSTTPHAGNDTLENMTPIQGSWWPHWRAWLRQINSTQVTARITPVSLAPAPGTYVQKKATE
ncbi:MAG: class I poly(R)-hydroxyalkanoic acid synthase [Pseudomonadota bacterium]